MDPMTNFGIGLLSGLFLVYTFHNFLGPKLFWLSNGADVFLTLVLPVLFAGSASGLAMSLGTGIAFTATLRIAHMFLPGEELRIYVPNKKFWPRIGWFPTPPKKFEFTRRRR